MWNLEKWYRWTYLQGRNGDTDIKHGHVDPRLRGEAGVGWIKRLGWTYIHSHVLNRKPAGACLLASAQTHVHWVGDAIQPPHPLLPPSPLALSLSQHQGLFLMVGGREVQEGGDTRIHIADLLLCIAGTGPPQGLSGKGSVCKAGDASSIPEEGKSPWRRAWQPTPVFLPGEFYRQRSLVGYSP